MKERLVWVGVRESDIFDTGNLFECSITIHGSGQNGNVSMDNSLGKRFNHNVESPEYAEFFENMMTKILEEDPKRRFVQYDSLDSQTFCKSLRDKILFRNEDCLLRRINNKVLFKTELAKYTDVLPYKVFLGEQLDEQCVCSVFPDCKKIVVQRECSCGGEGTFLVASETEAIKKLPISQTEKVIVTEFQEKNISINIHAVLYKDEILMFAPSVQLISIKNNILQYIGSDFSAYSQITKEKQNLIMESGMQVCRYLQAQGYLGACGIDMILVDDRCYFMEVNGRFQASTALLNRYLVKEGFQSIQAYHIDAFLYNSPTLPKPSQTAEGSMIVFSYANSMSDQLRWFYNKLEGNLHFALCDDSVRWDAPIQSGSYVFQLYSNEAIASVTFQNTVRLHPNVQISPFILDNTYTYSNLIRVKILLLSRGISVSDIVWKRLYTRGGIDWEEFGAVTLKLFKKIWVTAPCAEPWYDISPLEIDYDQDMEQIMLYFYGKPLFPVEIMKEDSHGKKQTKGGHYIKDIVYRNPDRLRIYYRDGCALQDKGIGCKFCDLYGTHKAFSFEDICQALSYYWNDKRVKHFLIGGGSDLPGVMNEEIVSIAKHIRHNSNKHIYLMMQPIKDMQFLRKLKEAGITEIAFNIEMFDRVLAQRIMPGKAKNTLQDYYESFQKAVELWGKNGNVRSIVLLGFDESEKFAQGIRLLCSLGVYPILSVFRPCSGTPLAKYMPPEETEIMRYYEIAQSICNEYEVCLGPSCKACQNNAVVLEI